MGKHPEAILCPRCNQDYYTPYETEGPYPKPAVSRTDNESYICTRCGTDEAMKDFAGSPLFTPDQWPI